MQCCDFEMVFPLNKYVYLLYIRSHDTSGEDEKFVMSPTLCSMPLYHVEFVL